MLARLTSSILFVAIVGIAVFGFLGMGHNYGAGCIASLFQRTVCPDTSTALDGAAFYTNALRGFSTATFDSVSMSVLLVSLLLTSVSAFLYAIVVISQKTFLVIRPVTYSLHETSATQKFSHWLSLREKRDPSSSF
ncbi:MAG: hypothetical protein U1D31_00640 [Patescibacteria group bacterium]|nr:hypothetical protein [bacterium]MDZ4240629.1 hypothetical protein [Patescibacteria group bacterium]